ncbi:MULTISPECIES: hypothetical protein [Streptomyces]|uniref:Uncharacterized protein n=1 Tax=Streptomyces venezuelae TaxID=54571 RepID=A0A5P2BGY7_STRVZ|nr:MULTISPECIES: hypothetical protein [Streptomyces]NEA05576.1 hypothetical protein [Streptomyces sp. SID10116]MYY85002.1 hypothetical protein [Streptomyces sp. SID335]MYZ11807.1 hypothetical protein [Streptomyces sp. SID337]NDZ86238.1 hypothetical protein [Streptomyces sp. SID10115]NEB47267.1 hypothetical protein [Streptomyces sp. SID339]
MACDLWLVPLVDVLCHSADNPFAEELAVYDKALHEAGLPPVPVFAYMPGLSGDVAPVAGFDYDALHFLRRAYLLQICGLEVTPVDELGGDYEQLLEMFDATAQRSHLVWHYDHAGAYVPVDFPVPLSNDELLAGGGPLGSSQALLRELEYVAPSIGIDPANPPLAPAPPSAPTSLEEPAAPPPPDESPFARERHVWLGLHAAATRSLAQGSMIIYS